MSARKEIVRLQWQILQKLKEDVRLHLGRQSRAFETYYGEYKKEFAKDFSLASVDELVEETKTSQIVLCGDYHTLRHAQRTNIRLLREIIQQTPQREIIIFMEMIHQEHQHILDQYMSGELAEEEFLGLVHYQETWGFNWLNYRPILDFARRHDIDVIGINISPKGPETHLAFRDRCAGEIIAQTSLRKPGALLWVVVGDLHLAPTHLPAAVKRTLDRARQPRGLLTIYQNSESIYWKLVARGLEDRVEIVRLGRRAFCVNNATPWIKVQSYLSWIEDGEEILVKVGAARDGEDDEIAPFYYSDQLLELVETMADFLNVRLDCPDCFETYTLDDLSFVAELKRKDRRYRKLIPFILRSKSFFIPKENINYLSRPDINHAAECAAEFIHYQCARYPIRWNFGSRDAFFRRVFREALGFFGSKIINPKRRCDHPELLLDLMRHGGSGPLGELFRTKYVIGRFILAHREGMLAILRGEAKTDPFKEFYSEDLKHYFNISRGIGYYMGDLLYRALIEGRVSREEIRRLFMQPLAKQGEPFTCHLDLYRTLTARDPSRARRHPAAGQ